MKRLIHLLFSLIGIFIVLNTDPEIVRADYPDKLTTPQLINLALENGEINQETAYLYLAYALSDYEKLPAQFQSNVPWDGTLSLLQLQEAIQKFSTEPEILEVESVLAGACYQDAEQLSSTINSENFYIQHDPNFHPIGGGLEIKDYVKVLEATWQAEIVEFGWAAPPVLPSNPPPGNRYHVRIQDLGGGLFGYVAPSGTHAGLVGNNPNTTWNDVDAYASCMVITSDLSALSEFPYSALEATAAHEFNHAIQFGYGALSGNNTPDEVFIEGGATWMEDEVFDGSNDNYNFLWPKFNQCMGEYKDNPYSYWITFRGITEQFGIGTPNGGEQLMQDFWEETSKSSSSNMLEALNFALENKGTNLGTAFHRYAIAVKFNKPCSGKYRAPYCFKEGPEYIKTAGEIPVHNSINKINGSTSGSIADNYAINWISLPAGNSNYDIALKNTSSGGQIRGSVVCDTGDSLKITSFSNIAGKGETSKVLNFNPSGCSTVIAVLTNQSQTAANPNICTLQSYKISTSPATVYTFIPLITYQIANITPPNEIPNWNFEKGSTDWTEYSSNGWNLIVDSILPGITTHSGNWLAWLGGDNNEISYIEQEIVVPKDYTNLSYWYWIDSDDECGVDLDFVEIVINESEVEDSFVLCTTTSTNGWEKKEIDLEPYAGKNIDFRIRVQTDESIPSSIFLEDFVFDTAEVLFSTQPLNSIMQKTSPIYKSDVLGK